MVKQFFNVTTSGILVSGKSATQFTRIPCSYFTKDKILRQQLLQGADYAVTFAGGVDSTQPELRIMDALGSTTNDENFVLLQEQINGMKARTMVGGTIREPAKMEGFLAERVYGTLFLEIKTAIAVYAYLNMEDVNLRMKRIIYHIRQQLELTDKAMAIKYSSTDIHMAAAWDEYLIDLFGYISKKSLLFVTYWLARIENQANEKEDEDYAPWIKEYCISLNRYAVNMIDLDMTDIVHGYTGDDDAMDLD